MGSPDPDFDGVQGSRWRVLAGGGSGMYSVVIG